jgi:hypothetical protein
MTKSSIKSRELKAGMTKQNHKAESSNTIPLDQKQQETGGEFAKAGSAVARQEGIIKQKFRKWWHTIIKR